MTRQLFKYVAIIICLLQLPFCKKVSSQQRDLTTINPEFDKKLEKLLSFSVPVMTVDELHTQQSDVFIIDTREQAEFETSHIPNAHFGGYKNFDISNYKHLPRDTTLVLYCSVGYRSEKIAEKFQQAGFTDVQNLYGSIFEWVNASYPVVNGNRETVDTVHTYNKKWGQWVDERKIKKIY